MQGGGSGSGRGDRPGGKHKQPKVAFVRLEKPTYLQDIEHTRASDARHGLTNRFLIESGASHKRKSELDRADKLEKGGKPGVGPARQKAGQFAASLDLIEKGAPDNPKIRQLRAKHATSSATSPYISATPTFTTGGEGQLHYLKAHLTEGRKSFVTIHESSRTITSNDTNSREKELLVPFGEQRSELKGFLQVTPTPDTSSVHALFVDFTHRPPRVSTGRKAVENFLLLNPREAPSASQSSVSERHNAPRADSFPSATGVKKSTRSSLAPKPTSSKPSANLPALRTATTTIKKPSLPSSSAAKGFTSPARRLGPAPTESKQSSLPPLVQSGASSSAPGRKPTK